MEMIVRHHKANRLINQGSSEVEVALSSDIQDSQAAKADKSLEDHADTDRNANTEYGDRVGNIIPPEAIKVFPTINNKKYSKVIKKQNFLQTRLQVCEECYLSLISLSKASGSLESDKLIVLQEKIQPIGTGKLKPEALRPRREDTMGRVKDNHIADYRRMLLLSNVVQKEMKVMDFETEKDRNFKKKPYGSVNPDLSRGQLLTRVDYEKTDEFQKSQVEKLIVENVNLTHILKQLTEKNSEKSNPNKSPGSYRAAPVLPKPVLKETLSPLSPKLSMVSAREQSKTSKSFFHRKLNSMALTERLRLIPVKPGGFEDQSTQRTQNSKFKMAQSKSMTSRLQSFSKGVTGQQMVGFEWTEHSSVTRDQSVAAMPSSRVKKKAHKTFSNQLFQMYESKKDSHN